MLAEFFGDCRHLACCEWYDVMDGVRACVFRMDPSGNKCPVEIPIQMEPEHHEALFFSSGAMMLRREQGALITAGSRDILMISNVDSIRSVQVAAPLEGVLVCVNTRNAVYSETTLCHLLGDLKLSHTQIRQQMGERKGCAVIKSTSWVHSVFSAMESLSSQEKGSYCVLKSVELLYLICTNSSTLEEENGLASPDSYLTRTVTEMKAYMENRLDEKLTIETMSRKFHISPTAFKSCFRRLYGQPVHHWLQSRRMKRAAELLHTTPMTVLQIAQSVGYDGGSQFNVAFKREFGMTPRQYKKMSESIGS